MRKRLSGPTRLPLIVSFTSFFLVVLAVSVYVQNAKPAAAAPSGMQKVDRPDLPSQATLYPNVFDENGCLKLLPEEGGLKCGPKDAHKQDVPSPNEAAMLKGFNGRYYSAQVDGQGVRLIPEAISVATAGTWSAMGLVRNETTRVVGKVSVTATLFGQGDVTLARVPAEVLVEHLRPGEPGPFAVKSLVTANDVVRVEWSVEYDNAPVKNREFLVSATVELPHGVATFKGFKREDAPYPYVLAADLTNVGSAARNAHFTVAWLNDNGRVIWIDSASTNKSTPEVIRPKFGANFDHISINDPVVGPQLFGASKLMWVVSD